MSSLLKCWSSSVFSPKKNRQRTLGPRRGTSGWPWRTPTNARRKGNSGGLGVQQKQWSQWFLWAQIWQPSFYQEFPFPKKNGRSISEMLKPTLLDICGSNLAVSSLKHDQMHCLELFFGWFELPRHATLCMPQLPSVMILYIHTRVASIE